MAAKFTECDVTIGTRQLVQFTEITFTGGGLDLAAQTFLCVARLLLFRIRRQILMGARLTQVQHIDDTLPNFGDMQRGGF